MRKRDALKLKAGDKVVNRHIGSQQTVKNVIPAATERFPRGNFPLVELVEDPDEATTYLLLEKV